MIKRLITWLHERFCQEELLTPELDAKDRKVFLFARCASSEFRGAAYTGQPKPAYPLFEGKELSSSAKEMLDDQYYDACALDGSSKFWVVK